MNEPHKYNTLDTKPKFIVCTLCKSRNITPMNKVEGFYMFATEWLCNVCSYRWFDDVG